MNEPTLQIRLYGDPCLTQKSAPVKEVGQPERLLIQSMIHTMHTHQGIGLAAPQVGINQRFFVLDVGQGPVAIVNPEVLEEEGSEVMEEGCLSIPGVAVEITRPKKIKVKYMDEDNKEVVAEFDELLARVFQHEKDHLDGKLILDYVDESKREELIEQFEKAIQENKE